MDTRGSTLQRLIDIADIIPYSPTELITAEFFAAFSFPLFCLACYSCALHFVNGFDVDDVFLTCCSDAYGMVVILGSLFGKELLYWFLDPEWDEEEEEVMQDIEEEVLWGLTVGCLVGFSIVKNWLPRWDLGDAEGMCYGGNRFLEIVGVLWGW